MNAIPNGEKSKIQSLQGKVAIVTGAGGGLGREYALLLARYGAKVVVNDYGGGLDGSSGTITMAQNVVDMIIANGGIAVADGHDVSKEDQSKAIVATAISNFGSVHILVNNAGIVGRRSTHDKLDVASFRHVHEVAVLGTIMLISNVYPIMQQNGYGRIINTASDSIYGMGIGGDTAYCSSKAAVYAMTKDLGKYSTRDGIKINAVSPSASSRMTDLSPLIKELSEKYFATAKAANFVVALASEECPVSGETFSTAGRRAARTCLATFPGCTTATSPEEYLARFNDAMGKVEDIYVPDDCLDQVRYNIKHGAGVDVGPLSEYVVGRV